MYFFSDRRYFNRRVSERRIANDYTIDNDRRIADRRSHRDRRVFNKGIAYRNTLKVKSGSRHRNYF